MSTAEDTIEWRDPPPQRAGKNSRNAQVAAMLKENPGRWAFVGTYRNPSVATRWRQKYGCEAATRHRPNGDCDIYVRWTGKEESQD